MAAQNAWRGERELALPGAAPVNLAASLDHIARLMAETKSETLEGLQDVLQARKPETLRAALAILIGEDEAATLWPHVNGAVGLTRVYAAISGAVSGLTPEEEDEAKKAQAESERDLQAMALGLLARAIGQSSASHSESG
ncbi:hypothetical protein R2G56_08320 [Nitratireductor aquimarinus]|uniref:Uncharacterized protein n=1 Tax=Nitratireductor aquimarinus TaxID=889300 RepID=A0ABU4AJ68_9HYPH|nr:hypothetical protein [Nitratireductor aquimarinus]MDV6226288.1 hypothetical protein [Nitratireductor aquimarinus]